MALEDNIGKEASAFHLNPILNSPYDEPGRHWVLDEGRQPTDKIGDGRREVSFGV